MRSIVIPLLIGLRSSLRSQAELQVEIVGLCISIWQCCSGVPQRDPRLRFGPPVSAASMFSARTDLR